MEDKSIYNKKKTGRKTKQKGFGWHSSLNPNAGDVEKSIEVFNNAQPDGGIGAVSSTSGNAMGEALQMSDGMVEDDFFTFERDNITYHFFFTPGRRTENKYAILAVDYGIRFDKEPYKNEKGATVIPMSRVHDKPQQVGYFEFTEKSHPEIVNAMEEEDRKEYRDLIVAEAKKHEVKNESLNEGLYGYQTFTRTGERGKPIYTLTYGNRNGFIAKYDKNSYMTTFGTEWEQHISHLIEWLREYYPGFFEKKVDGEFRRFIPAEGEAIEYIKNEIKRGKALSEATASTKYSYTGPIYHLGNKIAEKSRMFTMAKSVKQAINNFRYKAANGDIVGHYDIVDDFVKEVEVPEIVSTVEEKPEIIKCDNCGTELNPMGDCPVCDYGEDDLLESIHIDSNLDALSQLNRME